MPLAPTPPGERLAHLDLLRGLALFGVLLENLQHFVEPSYAAVVAAPDATLADRAALGLVRALCENKVYLLFSLLFGHGVALQLRRSEAAGGGFVGLHSWRMAVLFLIGLGHSMLWNGDILTTYALLGLVLLPLRGVSERALALLAAAGFAAPAVGLGLLAALAPEGDAALQADVARRIYPLRQAAFALAGFVVGLGLGRRGLLAEPQRIVAWTRRRLPAALAIALPCNAALPFLMDAPGQGSLTPGGVALEGVVALGTPAAAIVYVHAALRLASGTRARRRLAPVVAAGRTSLTHYVLQSAIGVGLLRPTGLGALGPAVGIVVASGVFALQAWSSRVWLARVSFGPLEWLWRATSYARIP